MTFRWKIAQAAEIRWWQRYLKNKPTADYAVWKTDYWQKLLAEIGLSDLNTEGGQKSILDAGCGPAGIFMIFKKQKVDALDPLLDEYEAILPHFKKSFYPNVQFYSQPLESFDKQDVYDAIFCLNAINHVADFARCFDILVAAAKKGGQLIVSIDAHNFLLLKHIFHASACSRPPEPSSKIFIKRSIFQKTLQINGVFIEFPLFLKLSFQFFVATST